MLSMKNEQHNIIYIKRINIFKKSAGNTMLHENNHTIKSPGWHWHLHDLVQSLLDGFAEGLQASHTEAPKQFCWRFHP